MFLQGAPSPQMFGASLTKNPGSAPLKYSEPPEITCVFSVRLTKIVIWVVIVVVPLTAIKLLSIVSAYIDYNEPNIKITKLRNLHLKFKKKSLFIFKILL